MATDHPTGLPEVFIRLRRRPDMWIFPVDLHGAVNFLYGYDNATGGRLLDGFCEWLALHIHPGSNLGITEAVLCLTFPRRDDPTTPPTDRGMHEEAIGRLFDLLDAFLADRSRPGGLERIRQARHDQVCAYLADNIQDGSFL